MSLYIYHLTCTAFRVTVLLHNRHDLHRTLYDADGGGYRSNMHSHQHVASCLAFTVSGKLMLPNACLTACTCFVRVR